MITTNVTCNLNLPIREIIKSRATTERSTSAKENKNRNHGTSKSEDNIS